jgi:RNA polymerase sigma-70 factor, ECF subfamily
MAGSPGEAGGVQSGTPPPTTAATGQRRIPAFSSEYFHEMVRSSPVSPMAAVGPVKGQGERADEQGASFRAWYEETLPRVYGYLFNRCGRNAELAEELTQETFFEALRSGHVLDRRDPATWLIGIARHRLVDHFRRLQRRERGLLRLVAARPPQTIWINPPDPDDRLADALTRLPAAQKAAIVLRYLDDLPVREVAQLLGRSEGATESLLSRGRAALRQSLAEDAR